MTVAVDTTPLMMTSGGLRRYTEELIRAMRNVFPQDTIHGLSDQTEVPKRFWDRRWWSVGLPRTLVTLRCDIFHGTDFAVPYIPVRPSVMTVHDLSPWMNPEWHHDATRVRRRAPLLIRSGLATMIVTPTQAVRHGVIERFGVEPDRVAAVPEAPAPQLRRIDMPPAPRPYFLFVGTLEPRKNVPALIDAWQTVRSRHDVDLLIVGRKREDAPELPSFPGLIKAGEVSDNDLARLYSRAVAVVYPSLYEGFGLPVVEAMQCGVPVITSNDPALLEVCGEAGIHADPQSLAQEMERLLVDEAARQRQRDLGLRRSGEFSWERTACLMHEVYAEAIARFRFIR